MHALTPTIARLVADIASDAGTPPETVRAGVHLLSRSAEYDGPRRLVSEFLTLVFRLHANQPKSISAQVTTIAAQLAAELAALPPGVSNLADAQQIILHGIIEDTPVHSYCLRAIDAITCDDLVATDVDVDEDDEDPLIDVLVTPFGRLYLGRHVSFSATERKSKTTYRTDVVPSGDALSDRRQVNLRHETFEDARAALRALFL